MIYHVLLQSDVIENEPHQHVLGVFSRLSLARAAVGHVLSRDKQRVTVLSVNTSKGRQDWPAEHYYWEADR